MTPIMYQLHKAICLLKENSSDGSIPEINLSVNGAKQLFAEMGKDWPTRGVETIEFAGATIRIATNMFDRPVRAVRQKSDPFGHYQLIDARGKVLAKSIPGRKLADFIAEKFNVN